MRVAADLHIHTCLSPCADDDMTPNNIINMSLLKGLGIIAITDHNSAKNVYACMKVAEGKDILVLPGMEVQTKEEVHLLCYFPKIQSLLQFDEFLYSYLPSTPNSKNIFGNQFICDESDFFVDEEPKLLVNSVNLSINQLVQKVDEMGGVVVPAHIDKPANSIIGNLGFIPEDLHISTVEISKRQSKTYPVYTNFQRIFSSDAHDLGSISEAEFFLHINEFSISAIIHWLKNSHK